VTLMSFRFFFAILVLNTILGTNNTLGVFITTLWQGSIGLILLSFIMMKKLPNPLYAKPEVLGKGLRSKDRGEKIGGGGERMEDRGERIEGRGERMEDRGERIEGRGERGPFNPQSPILNPGATAPVRHERPKRFVYGEKPVT